MTGYEKRTEAKKRAIVAAARELFTERGVKDVGVSEIAAKAHVSQVSIYNYFGDKNALAREVMNAFLDQAVREYDEILDRDLPFPEKLRIIMEKKHDKVIEAGRSHFSAYAWEDRTLRQTFWEAADSKSSRIYERFIELGKREGAIDETIPDEAVLRFLRLSLSVMQDPGYPETDPEFKLGIFRMFMYGFLGKDGAR